MWKLKLWFTASWFRKNQLEVLKHRWEGARWRAFNCSSWAIQPTNERRGEIVRLGRNLYVLKFRVRNIVFLKLHQS